MGVEIALADTFTGANLPPILYPDFGMSAGTLLLVDPSHSKGAFSGVPTSGVIPNIARDVAAGILGVAASTLDPSVSLTRDASNALLVERTTKLGVHGLPSQANQTTQNNNWQLTIPNSIRDYIFNNIQPGGHGLYVSLWGMKTRSYISGSAPQSPVHCHNVSAATSNFLFHMQNLQANWNSAANLGNSGSAVPALNTPFLLEAGVSGWQGTKPSTSANMTILAMLGIGGAWGSLNINKGEGMVLYRMKIEDLYLTKRTHSGAGGTLAEEYAAALAQDQSDFNAAFASGGKFYGDTTPGTNFTNPSGYP